MEFWIDGELDASSEFDQGGLVTSRIKLISEISVDAGSNGGDVLVGGDCKEVKEELRVMESPNVANIVVLMKGCSY